MRKPRLSAAAFVLAMAFVAGATGAAQQGSTANAGIVGVWKIAEVRTTGANARTITNPQPSVRIFTRRHFSVTEVNSDKPRPELPTANATDAQLAAAFGPFTARAGTYEIKGNEIS